MTTEARDLLDAALALSTGERAGVAAALLASLDDSAEASGDSEAIEAAWVAELEARARRAAAGQSSGTPWGEVRAQVADRLARG